MASESSQNPPPISLHSNTPASAPEKGNTYKIVEIDSERALTLVGGRLTLVLDVGTRGGWQWECEEHDGWIGFRDAVSGKYLGRVDQGRCVVEASALNPTSSFVLRPRAAGGYNLCLRNCYGNLAPIGISKNNGSFILVDVESYDEAVRWEFYKV